MNRQFWWLWGANFTSVVGDYVQSVALMLLVADRTGSPVHVGLMMILSQAPMILLGPLAGERVDAWNPRKVMIASDLVRATLVFAIPWAASASGQIWMLYLLAVLQSVAACFFGPARGSQIREIVPSDQLMKANGRLEGATSAASLVGLALGGLLYPLGSLIAFWLNAATFVISALLVAAIRAGATQATQDQKLEPFWRRVGKGIIFTWQEPQLRSILVLELTVAFGFGMIPVVWPFFAREIHHAWGYPVLLAAMSVGGLLGSWLPERLKGSAPGKVIGGGALIYGLSMVALSQVHNLSVAVGLTLIVGLFLPAISAATRTARQLLTPREMLGRVFAFSMAMGGFVGLASRMTGGLLSDVLGARGNLVVAGAIMGAAGLIGLVFLKNRSPHSTQPSVSQGGI